MNILGLSGRKQSGKNTCANLIIGWEMLGLGLTSNFKLTDRGQLWVSDIFGDSENNQGVFDVMNQSLAMKKFLEEYLDPFVKLYSFADLLKRNVCMDVLGLSYEQCYGTDKEKNSKTEILSPKTNKEATAREVMQFVGTDFFRQIYPNVWVDATIRKIQEDSPCLSIVCDCRFPNEVEGIQKAGGKVIRLTKNGSSSDVHESETALDKNNFDWNKFDKIIDNESLEVGQQSEAIYNTMKEWGWLSLEINEGAQSS